MIRVRTILADVDDALTDLALTALAVCLASTVWLVAQAKRVPGVLEHVGAWYRRLQAANAYQPRHRKDSIPPYVHWMAEWRARRQHWIATQPRPELRLDDTQWDLPPVVDGPASPVRPDLSAGSAHYLRLQPVQLERDLELVFTRTETFPLRAAAPPWKDYDGPRVFRLDGKGTAHAGKMLCPTCTPIVAQREWEDFLRRETTS